MRCVGNKRMVIVMAVWVHVIERGKFVMPCVGNKRKVIVMCCVGSRD